MGLWPNLIAVTSSEMARTITEILAPAPRFGNGRVGSFTIQRWNYFGKDLQRGGWGAGPAGCRAWGRLPNPISTG
jgi:hypothetical protein